MSKSQLFKKDGLDYKNIYPSNFTENITDKYGNNLQVVLNGYNMYFVSYIKDKATTRKQVPMHLRREGLWITYVESRTVITEWYNSNDITDTAWGLDDNWRDGSNHLIGDISISSDGYWVVNGEKTETQARGEKGIPALMRYSVVDRDSGNGILELSYKDVDHKEWETLVEFKNYVKIEGYVVTEDKLPIDAPQGTMYMQGPNETPEGNTYYNLYVYAVNSDGILGWQDSGPFTSFNAGVADDKGDSTSVVMTQRATTEYLNNIEARLGQLETAVEDIADSLQQESSTIDSLETTVSNLQSKDTELSSNVDTLNSTVSVHEERLDDHGTRIGDIESGIPTIQEKTSALETNLAQEIETRTRKDATINTSINELRGELTELGSKVDGLDNVLNGTVASNITHSFNSDYEYWRLSDVIASGTPIKNNSQYSLVIYTTNDASGEVKTIAPNDIYTPDVDIFWLRCTKRGDYSLSVGVTTKGLADRFEEVIEELNDNDAMQYADLEILKKDMYEEVYSKSLGTFEFYGSETEPLSHIIRKGSVVKNNSTQKIAIYNSDKSINVVLKSQEIITIDFDVYFLRNWDFSQTINVSVASALDSSLFRENAIKKRVLGYGIDLNLTKYQYYPDEGKASNILINKDVYVKNNGTHAVMLYNVDISQSIKIGFGERARVTFDVFYIRNYSDYTVPVSLEIEGLPSVEERVKVLEENSSSSIDSIVVNVSDSTGVPSGSASLDDGVLTLQLNNIKGERGNDGAQGVQGNSGVASSDGIESVQDLSQDIPNDTEERVYVAGAKVVKDKIEYLYRNKAPYSQFYGNRNTAKNINGGSGKSVIIGDDNGMYATNDANCNTLIGYHADYGLTTGHSNTAIGCEALDRNRSGHDNVAVGMFAVGCNNLNAADPTTYKSCTYNVGVGSYALHHNGGVGNTAIGNFSAQSLDDDDTDNSNGNTSVGNYSLAYNKQGSYNVCIGNAAGKYSQGSLELYIDAIDRGDDSRNNPENITKGRTKSLVYGKFDGSPSSQKFYINAGLIVMPYLPSSDPHVIGALWNDGGVLKISNG